MWNPSWSQQPNETRGRCENRLHRGIEPRVGLASARVLQAKVGSARLRRGESIAFDIHWANGAADRVSDFSKELIASKPDVIFVTAGSIAVVLKPLTTSIPIVVINAGDPVGSGLAQSLSRPGRNVTRLSNLASDLSPKIVELLRALVPALSRVGVLGTGGAAGYPLIFENLRQACQSLALPMSLAHATNLAEFEPTLIRLTGERCNGLVVPAAPLMFLYRHDLVGLVAKHRLPAVYYAKEYVEAGGLLSYGPSMTESYIRGADQVSRILNGARPADLPFEQPSRIELVINVRAARAIDLTLPRVLLLQADQLIE